MYKIFRNWMNRYFADEEAVLLIILLVAAIAIMMTMGNILAPMISSIIIAFLMQGMVARLEGRGLPHMASVIIAWSVLVCAMALAIFVLLPVIWRQLIKLVSEIPTMLANWREVILLLPEKMPDLIRASEVERLLNQVNRELNSFELGSIGQSVLSFSVSQLPLLMGLLIYVVLVPILVFFFLKDSQKILSWLSQFLPNDRPVMTKIWKEMNLQIANYVRGKVIEILIVTSVTYFAFALLDLNYALLLGLVVGLSVVIPYIGAAVVTVPVALIAYFQWGWSSEFFTVMIVYGIIQMLDGNVLVPLLFSEAVNLHPVAIILAVLVCGGIWGFWGVFFAIPLATLAKAILNAWPMEESPPQEQDDWRDSSSLQADQAAVSAPQQVESTVQQSATTVEDDQS